MRFGVFGCIDGNGLAIFGCVCGEPCCDPERSRVLRAAARPSSSPSEVTRIGERGDNPDRKEVLIAVDFGVFGGQIPDPNRSSALRLLTWLLLEPGWGGLRELRGAIRIAEKLG